MLYRNPSIGGGEMEERGDDEPHSSQEQETRTHSGSCLVKRLPLVLHPAGKHSGPEYEQDVTDDRTGEGGFDDIVKARTQSDNRDNEFCGIAKRSVEQCANAGADVARQMFGGSPQQARERNNSKSGRHKDQQWIGSKDFERDRHWDKDEQEIKPRREEMSHAQTLTRP